jgi:hypothetical protein
MAVLPQKVACQIVVGALAFAHERGCEADLAAAHIDAQLDAGIMSALAGLALFGPDPAVLPEVTVALTLLEDNEAFAAAPVEEARAWPRPTAFRPPDGSITVHIPMTFRKRGGRKQVVTPDGVGGQVIEAVRRHPGLRGVALA